MQKLERAMSSILEENIVECSKLYGFDASEAMSRLTMIATSKKEVVVVKEKVRKSVSNSISMPFNKMYVKEELCGGLEYNHGLFTQCKNVHLENKVYCKSCLEESVSSNNGMPVCGTVEDRLSKGLMEFRDSKGRAPVSYLNYLKKKNSSVEEAKRIGKENSIEIEEEHFVEVDGRRGRPKKVTDESSVVKSEKRGRPKKTPTEVKSVKVIDLFASSVSEILDNSSVSSVEESSVCSEEEEVVVEKTINSNEVIESGVKKEKKEKKMKEPKESNEEKEAKKKALEEEKEAKKKAAEEEKEAKKKALEEEKEAKKKAAEEEKEAKKKAAEQEKEAKKLAKETKKQEKVKESVAVVVEEVVEVAAKVQVEEFTFEGVTYWKSSENILYDPKTQDTMGIWCDKTKSILPAPEESDDELDEEEYESDDE